MLAIDVIDEQDQLRFDGARLRQAASTILSDVGIDEGSVNIAVVDDATIHLLNQKYLDHDYPTDVLSFVLEQEGHSLEGEVIVSAETALRTAEIVGWSADEELLLYVIHGTLHLVGYDDLEDQPRHIMREAERRYLALFGIEYREHPEAQ
jgi:probable rRNA maturation factor